MSPNRRRIHGMVCIVGHRLGQCRRDAFPDPGLAPSSEALIDRNPFAIFVRQVAPWRARTNTPKNTVHDLPIVERWTAFASAFRRQKGFEQAPFCVAQIAATQSCLPTRGILESKSESRVNLFVNRA